MSAQYTATTRGIKIDVTQTLNKFLGTNQKQYSKKQFEDYLKQLGLTCKYANTGENNPIDDGFVVTFDYEESDNQDAYAILATGMWSLHYTQGSFSKEELKRQINFLDEKHLDKNTENRLRDLWKDKLILQKGFGVESDQCENVYAFLPNNNTKEMKQSGGGFSFLPKNNINKTRKRYVLRKL